MTKILVVEDNEQLGQLLVERLERRNHQVSLASDSEAAFAAAKSIHPEVILLESQLRGGEEWATARKLKYDDHTREIPIIGLLANNTEEARDLAMRSGCVETHGKPVDFGKLLAQIDAAVSNDETSDDSE